MFHLLLLFLECSCSREPFMYSVRNLPVSSEEGLRLFNKLLSSVEKFSFNCRGERKPISFRFAGAGLNETASWLIRLFLWFFEGRVNVVVAYLR